MNVLMTASILTNTSAMVALQTLQATNNSLEKVQSQISTGKAVALAKDNAAMIAISEVMESDVAGFSARSDSLSLGSSTLAVASDDAKQIDEILNDIKGKVVAANEANADRQKLQNEIVSLRNQVTGTHTVQVGDNTEAVVAGLNNGLYAAAPASS